MNECADERMHERTNEPTNEYTGLHPVLGYFAPSGLGGLMHLALLEAWIATALDLGASAGDLPRQESFGAEAWLLDPEGNRLLLLVVPAS
jgi:hypothetical protein